MDKIFFSFILILILYSQLFAQNSDDGKKVFETKCSQCHSLDLPLSERHDRSGWENKVIAMQGFGCKLSDEEARIIIEYLTKHYGK